MDLAIKVIDNIFLRMDHRALVSNLIQKPARCTASLKRINKRFDRRIRTAYVPVGSPVRSNIGRHPFWWDQLRSGE